MKYEEWRMHYDDMPGCHHLNSEWKVDFSHRKQKQILSAYFPVSGMCVLLHTRTHTHALQQVWVLQSVIDGWNVVITF